MAYEKKITFKKGKKDTGLARIGQGTPSTEIKYDGHTIGYITFNNHWSDRGPDRGKIIIRFKRKTTPVPDSNGRCNWNWMRVSADFVDEQAARDYVIERAGAFIEACYMDKGLGGD